MTNADPSYSPQSNTVPPVQEATPRQGMRKGRVTTGLAALTTAAAMVAGCAPTGHEAMPVPHELHVEGSIDMDAFRTQVATPDILATRVGMDSTGVKVIKLSEYTPTPGRKLINDRAEFISVADVPLGDVREKLDQVMAADADVLNALASEGRLGAVRFNMALDPKAEDLEGLPDGDMRFIPAGDEDGLPTSAVIEYTLPATGEVSMNTMAGMIGHEAAHIEQQPLEIIDTFVDGKRVAPEDPVKVDLEAYRSDIAAIRKEAIAVAEQDPKVIAAAKKVLSVTVNAKTEVAKKERELAQSILDGTFNDYQPTQKKPSGVEDYTVDEGRIDAPGFVLSLNSGLTDEQKAQITPQQKNAVSTLDVSFQEAVETSESPLALFDESTYMDGARPIYGHPRSNTNELTADAENVLRSYPKQLVERLKKFSPSVQQLAVRFLKRLNSDTKRTAMRDGYVPTATQELHDKSDANMKWVEKQIEQ